MDIRDETKNENEVDEALLASLQQKEAAKVLDHVIRGILFHYDGAADFDSKMTRNFLAKGAMLVRSIFTLWEIEAYQECEILYRCLVDRLFHLHKLTSDNSFESFDEWSFVKQHELFARLRSDPRFKTQTDKMNPVSDEERQRFRDLKKRGAKWKMPKAKEMAAGMKRDYLYLYGYEFSSMHVHPMSNDGIQDFQTITGLKGSRIEEFPSHEYVLRNALLVLWLLSKDAVSSTAAHFTVLLDDFMLKFFEYIETGSQAYWAPYLALVEEFKSGKEWLQLKPQKLA